MQAAAETIVELARDKRYVGGTVGVLAVAIQAAIGVPHMVSIAGAGAHAVWPTLEGRTAADVARFHAAHLTARHSGPRAVQGGPR